MDKQQRREPSREAVALAAQVAGGHMTREQAIDRLAEGLMASRHVRKAGK